MKFFKIGLKRRENEIDHLVQGGHVPNTEGSYWLALVYAATFQEISIVKQDTSEKVAF